jgi:hypothetical protein
MAKRRRRIPRRPRLANPFLAATTELTLKSCEIGLAAGQTVFHRSLMMAGANMAALSAAERFEFTRMYTEKIQTALKCGSIMGQEMLRLNQQSATMGWSQMMGAAAAMGSLAPGQNPAKGFAAPKRLIGSAAQEAGQAVQNISTAMARAAAKGLTPVHTAVSANAKRLGRSAI